MNASLRALLRGLIDYAGLFPPARLPLHTAVGNFAQYQSESEAWLLGRFICSASSLNDLETSCHGLFSESVPLPLSVLGKGGATGAEDAFLFNLGSDLRTLRAFLKRLGDHTNADVFEVRLPAETLATGAAAVAGLLGLVETQFRKHDFALLRPFYEVPLGANWQEQIPQAIDGLSRFNATRTGQQPRAGFKLRCGGLEAAAFPTVPQVALCLRQCIAHAVPFKATAGLHHPLRRFDSTVQTQTHGFINVFSGGVLAAVHDFDVDHLQHILADEDPEHFRFGDDRFSWRGYEVSTQDITARRATLLTSFGSCSFDEPRDDLRALGWL